MNHESNVPVSHREGADEIRSHLVMLRGGAPFLSSSDALLLVHWMDDDVPVEVILCALERAAEARRKSRSRVPLSLRHAKRHLGKVGRGAWRRPPATERSHPLGALIARLESAALTDASRDPLLELARALEALPESPRDTLLRQALAAIRCFFDAAWDGLSGSHRQDLQTAAVDELGDLLDMVDESTAASILHETARDLFRQRYPWVSAGTVYGLVEA